MVQKQFYDIYNNEIIGFGSDNQDLHLKIKIEQFYLYRDLGEKVICENCAIEFLKPFKLKPYHKQYKRGLTI